MSSRKQIARSRPTDAWRAPLTRICTRQTHNPRRRVCGRIALKRGFLPTCRSNPPSAPRTSVRPIEPPSWPATDLPRLAAIAPDHLVGDRSRHVARDDLARRQAAALDVGAEDGADDRADLAEDAAATSARRAIGRRSRAGNALLDHLVGGLGIDRGVVFALHRARIHDRLALFRRDRPDAGRWRPDHAHARPSPACRCLRGRTPAPRPCRAP